MLQNETVALAGLIAALVATCWAWGVPTKMPVLGWNQLLCSKLTAPLSVPGSLALAWRVSPLKKAEGRASSKTDWPLCTRSTSSVRVAIMLALS